MSLRHLRPFVLIPLLASIASFAMTGRAVADTGTVSLNQSAYTADEYQGTLAVTIVRTGDLSGPEQVGYGVKQQDAQNGIDFDAIPNTYITMQPGQKTYTFNVKIIDQDMDATPVHALAYLYGS